MKAGVWSHARQVVFLLAAVLPVGVSAGVTPLQKVAQLLQGMIEAGEEEKHQEQLQYAVFEQFCTHTIAEKKHGIEEANRQLELLAAEVLKHTTEAERLAFEILEHQAKMTSLQNESEVAAGVHAEERQEYLVMHQNYSESIFALTQAITTLKRQAHGSGGEGAFLARGSEEPELQYVPPPERQYEFQSGDVVKMLEQLQDKFRGELADLEKQELSRGHAYNMLDQNLKNAMKVEDSLTLSKQKSKLQHLQQLNGLKADQKDVAAKLGVDEKSLQDVQSTCQQKEQEYQSRQELRNKELEVLEKAVAILTSEEVAATAAKHLPSFLQSGNSGVAMALAQLRSVGDGASLSRAADFLLEESKRLESHVLSTIAMHARQDPFAKVKKLIEELITRLMTQATREAEHKGWCDTELATNEHTRTSKSQQVESLTAEIDGLAAAIAQLQKDVVSLSAEVSEIDSEVKEATSLRNKEKAENANITMEAQQAQASVKAAIALLEDFYRAASANATALLSREASGQARSRSARQEPPPIWGSEPYKGQQVESGGVIAMLQVIQSDFARLESETAQAEAQAAQAHKVFMTDSLVAKAQMNTDIKHKNADRENKEIAVMDKKRALEDAQHILAGALQEYEQLKPACLSGGQSYQERVQRREEEIVALKKALDILSQDFGL